MADEIHRLANISRVVTEINQYGDKAIHADNIENLTVNISDGVTAVHSNEAGMPYTPITPTRYDSVLRIIYLGSEKIKLPVQLIPQEAIEKSELPYINALCEVYAEKLNQTVTPDIINSLSTSIKRNFAEQRKAYYSAESLQRSVREVYADGEYQFQNLKDDAYEGISPIYYDDRISTGYERLLDVLKQITSITLSKSALINIAGLIGNLEKKGLCHMLVNDDIIKSWVNIDE